MIDWKQRRPGNPGIVIGDNQEDRILPVTGGFCLTDKFTEHAIGISDGFFAG